MKKIIYILSGSLSLFVVLAVGFYIMEPERKLSVFLSTSLILVFMSKPLSERFYGRIVDLLLILVSAAAGAYFYADYWNLIYRVGTPNTLDIILGFGVVLVILEATRRTVGMPLVIIIIAFLLYAFFGNFLPIQLSHRGYTVGRIASSVFMSNNGIFGLPLAVMFEYVFLFVLFGSFLGLAGTSDLFMDLATSLFGSFVGGPAKISVLTSALFGTISGSAVANVTVDGVFNIPLMKKTGFKPTVAAAVEAVTSTGGQLMPPVMGAAAFIMADFLGIPYAKVAKAAALPAILYYISLYSIIHFYSLKSGLRGLPRQELPKLGEVIKTKGYLLLPIFLLIYFLGAGYSASLAILYTMVAVILLSLFSKKHRITLKRGFNGMEETARDSLPIAITCAAAGVIIGIILMTGLGNKLSEFVLFISGGRLFLILFFTMVASLILGMGLPTTVCYILLAVTVAPTIVQMGVPPLAAHLFIFYFGLLCMVTPPVAMAAYAAAGIAHTDPMKTGYIAWWFSLSGYILPYIWVYNPSLILMGSTWEIIQASITATIGVVILGAGISGYFRKECSWWERLVLMVAAVLLIKPGMISDIIGFVLAGGVFLYQEITIRKSQISNSEKRMR